MIVDLLWVVLLAAFPCAHCITTRERKIRQQRYDARFAESIVNLKLQACFTKNPICRDSEDSKSLRPYAMIPPASKLHWCLKLVTDKRPELVSHRFNHTLSKMNPTLDIEWWTVDPDPGTPPGAICQFQFKGFQRNYHLSPDFGAYRECNTQMSSWRHALMSTKRQPTLPFYTVDSSESMCPITKLPLNDNQYQTCILKANKWFILQIKSTVSIEEKKGHEKFIVQHSGTRFFHTDAKNKWKEQKMVTVTPKSYNCTAKILIHLDPSWKHTVFIKVYKRAENEEKSFLTNVTLLNGGPEWAVVSFPLNAHNVSQRQEVCWRVEAWVPGRANGSIEEMVVTRDDECVLLASVMCSGASLVPCACLLLFFIGVVLS